MAASKVPGIILFLRNTKQYNHLSYIPFKTAPCATIHFASGSKGVGNIPGSHFVKAFSLSGYTLGSSFSPKHLERGGVCIFVRKDLNINKTDISHACREKDLEICAVELETEATKLIILSVCIELLQEILINS